MNVKLLRIDAADTGERLDGDRIVRVLVEVEGVPEWHEVQVRPNYLPDRDVNLLRASEALHDRLASEPQALYRIVKLAGKELRGLGVPLPELVAA